MKYLLTLAICMCTALSAFAHNESVSAISYNPSRLGAYSHLKAVSKAVIPGGVNWGKIYKPENLANVINIASKDTVTFRDEQEGETHKCTTKPCQNINEIMIIKPVNNKTVGVAIVPTSCSSALPCGSTEAFMPNTAIVGDYTENIAEMASSFSYNTTIPPSTFSSVVVERGGEVTALEDSYIQTLAKKGSSGERDTEVSVKTLEELQDFRALTSFKLGDVTINPPLSSGTTGYQWKSLTDSNGESHKVLAVK